MRSFSRSITTATGLLVLAVGLVSLPAHPSFAASDPAADGAAPTVESIEDFEHHSYESAPGVPMDGPPEGLALETEALASAPIEVKLVTAKLADTGTSIVDIEAGKRAVAATSNYWKAMSGGRVSMTVNPELTKVGHVSKAKSTEPYWDVINTITAELKWSYSTNKALVIFIPTERLGGWALGVTYSSSGNSGRVLMPKISGFTNPVMAHEFGHVLGAMHADSLQCGSGVSDVGTTSTGQFQDATCSIREYGDSTDLMGMSNFTMPVISSPTWEARGLGQGTEVQNIGVATGIKTYTLLPWGGTAPNRALKFTDPVSREVYYLELRQPVGYDNYLSSDYAGNRGVKIVQRGGATPASSLILMPSTRPFTGTYATNHAWQAGQTFVTHAGTRVTVNSVSATSATVTINADPGTRTKIQFSAGDFNGDGRADMISRESEGSLLLHAGQPGNKIAAPVRIGSSWNAFNSVFGNGDFNGDGLTDLIARTSDGGLWLYPGNGTGGFLTRAEIGSGWYIFKRIVPAGDFDGDGHTDLFGVRSDGALWLYPGNGTGGFLSAKQVGSEWQGFASLAPAGELGGSTSGLLARTSGGTVYLYPGNGTGGFGAARTLATGWSNVSDLIGGQDFTSDGTTDVLAASTSGSLTSYPGSGTGFASKLAIGNGWGSFSQVWEAGDFDGDGKPDILAISAQGALILYPGNGSGGFRAARQVGSAGWQTFDQVLSAGNFNGAGGPDIVARTADGSLWLYPTDGKGNFQTRKAIGNGWGIFTQMLAPGDFSGDGRNDIIGMTADGKLWLYPGNGTGGFQNRKQIGSGWGIFDKVIAANDFNGDGKADIMARTEAGELWLYPGNGTSGFLSRRQLATGWTDQESFASVGRFGGTANPNVIAVTADGKLWLYTGTGTGAFQNVALNPR
ncbi:FG-GAP-like repeat-containing protein [Arthrobacter sp. ISL-28]|uniref:FG-GAP-like repeat-containing protein n=1 Tax=Arthrobacter sp. ISL-28 TaxID=2819108 RepID=UPI001BE5C6BC|nr:FG-GAP-like repeat-containing protein [Arthrobacter sp. ISL-28]MBT2522243.1 VCBS repeat-containing protein [Arthrobacter sp. ISL-28]